MTYYNSFGIEFECDETQEGLVAAGNRWTSGGNSTLARRARVALQRRDRYGRWAEMGGGISFPGRLGNGTIEKFVGRYVGPAERPDYMRVYVTEARRPGIYEVPSRVATVAKALLSKEALKDVGVNLDVNGNRVGEILDRDIEFIDQMWKGNKPTDFELSMARGEVSKPEKRVIEKARLRAPKHKSYNIVDEKGNRIDKDEEPAKPDVKKPSKKAKPAEKFPVPDTSQWDEKRQSNDVWYEKDGKRIPDERLTEADKTPENKRIYIREGEKGENDKIIDGNGNLIEFKPSLKPESSPIPEKLPEHDPEEGFWNKARVRREEVRKNLKTPQEIYEELYNGGFAEADLDKAIAACDYALSQQKYLGRDENPLYASNPDDPRLRHIANLLESLPEWQEYRIKRAINLRFMNEENIDELKAWVDGKIEPGSPLSPEDMVELHRKFRNLAVDITNLRISGEDAFSNDNLGAERINMPQLDEKNLPLFLRDMARIGVGHRYTRMMPDQLHPVQMEMDMGDIAKIAESWKDIELFNKFNPHENPIVISRDGYVLDGHHRWAAAWLAQKRGDKLALKGLKVVQLDIDHEQALTIANEWNDYAGIRRITVGGKDVREPRPQAPAVPQATSKITSPSATPDLPRVSPQPDLVVNYAPSDDNLSTPSGENFKSFLDRELANVGDKIIPDFGDRLTEDTPNPEDRNSPFPGSRTVVNNLLKYRDSMIKAMKESALDQDQEKFRYQFEIAKRVTKLLNQIHENFSNNKNYAADTELSISTSNPEEKLKTVRVLPNTVRYGTDNNGIRKVQYFEAIIIAKNGKPYMVKWTPDHSHAHSIDKNGIVNDSNDGGGISFNGGQMYDEIVDGKPVPRIASVGGAFTNDGHHALGLASAHINLIRWVQSMFGGRLKHSSNLSARGNPYSKMVSRDMRWHDRSQADKAVHMSCPNATIFKVLKDMGLISGEYIPATPGAKQDDDTPGGYGAHSGGRGWLRRLTFTNNSGYSSNVSVLTSYSINDEVRAYDGEFLRKTPEEQQAILDAMPPIFRDFFAGDRSRDSIGRTADFDVQYKILETAYADGMKQQEAVDFLDSLITGLPELDRAFGRNADHRELLRRLKQLRDGISIGFWNQSDNNYNRPKSFDPNSIRAIESPFAGYFKFNDWVLPRDVNRVLNDLPFSARPHRGGWSKPDGWTEEPQALKDLYGPEILLASLRDALLNKKGKSAKLPDINGEENTVDPTAVYKALENNGYDTELILAGIYDELNGNSVNTEKLLAKRQELGNLQGIIEEITNEIADVKAPIEFSRIGGEYDSESKVLQSDLVRRGETGEIPTALQLRPLSLDNEAYDYLGPTGARTQVILSQHHTPEISMSRYYIDGVSDNPKVIARNFNPTGLRNALIDSVTKNNYAVKLRYPNGQTIDVPNNAIRDALQYQGYDINTVLREEPSLKPKLKRISSVSDRENADGNGTRISEWAIYNSSGEEIRLNGPGIRQKRNDTTGEHEWDVVDLSSPQDNRTIVAKLAKVKKNDEGNYEVWVANRADNKTDEFSGEPSGVYETLQEALYDVKNHISDDANIDASTNLLGQGRAPTVSNGFAIVGGANDEAEVTVGDLTLQRPDGAESFVVFSNGAGTGRFRRISTARIENNTIGTVYTAETYSVGEDGGKIEAFDLVRKSFIGSDPVRKQRIYEIAKTNRGFELTTHKYHPDEGGVTRTETLVFDNYEDAKDYANKKLLAGHIGLPGEKVFPNLSVRQERVPASADLSNQNIFQDNSSIQINTPVKMTDGVKGLLKINVKKGAHPTWRNGEDNQQYVFAEFSFGNEPDEPLITGKITRTGVRQWVTVSSTNSPSFKEHAISSILRNGTFFANSKEEAFESLKYRLEESFGITNQQRADGQSVLPRIRLVNRAVKLEPPPPPPAPEDKSLFADGVFDDFLRVRNTPLDITGAEDKGGMGLGQSGSRKYELPDGRKFKVKDEGARKAASESLNHALHLALGIPATEARTGKAPGTTHAVNVIDPFEPDIVSGRRNGHMPGQDLFKDSEFDKPENQQAIADIQEGLIIDYWLGNQDFVLNTGNSFVAVRDGVRRGVRCDVGGGMFTAIRQQLINNFADGNDAVEEFIHYCGDFMNSGRVNKSSESGHMRRGLTKEKMLDIARRTLLRYTDDKIDRIVDAHITDPNDNALAKQGLKARRLAMLNYLGIDHNETPPTRQAPAVQAPRVQPPTANVPGGTPNELPNGANGAVPVVGINPAGKPIVGLPGELQSNGLWVMPLEAITPDIANAIARGEVVPENLPLHAVDSTNPENSIVIDGSGVPRPASALNHGYTTVIARRKDANGNYQYLLVKPDGDNTPFGRANRDRFGGAYKEHERFDVRPSAQEILNERFGVEAENKVVATQEILRSVPGLDGVHRVIIADIADFDMSISQPHPTQGYALSRRWAIWSQNPYGDQGDDNFIPLDATERERLVSKARRWENTNPAPAGNQPPSGGDSNGGDDGSGPSNPSNGGGGTTPPMSGSDDDWQPFSRFTAISALPGMPEMEFEFNIYRRRDGAVKVVSEFDNLLGHVKPLEHGYWVATLMPDKIGTNNNVGAEKAFFRNKSDAENWLSRRIYNQVGVREDARRRFTDHPTDTTFFPDVQPPFVVERGYLNPTTDAQSRLAKRLVKNKQATAEERAMYKAILSQRNPTVGDVGWIIGQLKDREDRDIAEIQASDQAELDAFNAGNPIQESSLENAGDGANRRHAVRAGDLEVGHRILGNINADVVFTVPGENDTVNIGVVGDDGQLKIYKVGRNRVLDCIYGRQAQQAPAQQPAAQGLAVRRRRNELIQDEIRRAYPNAYTLPNGDIIIGKRDHRMADGRVFRYEAVVHKLKSDEFVGYVRRQELGADRAPTGPSEAAYLTTPAHSATALKNRLRKRVVPALTAANPANGFNQVGDVQPEVTDPSTGLLLPETLVNLQKRFIGTTGIEKTGHPAKDALIEYVQTLVARGISAPEIINQVTGPNQRLFSRAQMDDIIDRLEANRLYPGVNVIPYVSKDNKTIVRVGDRVVHYNADGTPKLMANGQPRTGTVVRRVPYTLNVKPSGQYEYTDQTFVQWDDTSRPHQAAPRRLEVTRRADGTDPIPAVQDSGSTPPSPSIDALPVQPKRVVPRPVAPSRRIPPIREPEQITESLIVQKMGQFTGQLPNNYTLDRSDAIDSANLGGRSPIVLTELTSDGEIIVGRVYQDGSSIVQEIRENGQAVSRRVARNLDDALEGLVLHAITQPFRRDDNESSDSSGGSSPDDAGGGVPTPPNNPPADGGEEAESSAPGLNLSRGRNGQSPQGVLLFINGTIPKINTFWDDDYPPTQYEVVRDENRTRFLGIGGDNPGAEAFIKVERTSEGNWKVVDPRRRRDNNGNYIDPDPYPAQYGDRNLAEAIAINDMTGNNENNRELLEAPETPAQNAPAVPSNQVPSDQELMDTDPAIRNFVNRGRVNNSRRLLTNGTEVTAYDADNEIASIQAPGPDGQYIVTDFRNGNVSGFSNRFEAIVQFGNILQSYDDQQGFNQVNLDSTPQRVPEIDLPWNDKRNEVQPLEISAIRSFEVIMDPNGDGNLAPVKVQINRNPDSTTFFVGDPISQDSDLNVIKYTAGWGVDGITSNSGEVKIFASRDEAEAAALNAFRDFYSDIRERYVAQGGNRNNAPAVPAVPATPTGPSNGGNGDTPPTNNPPVPPAQPPVPPAQTPVPPAQEPADAVEPEIPQGRPRVNTVKPGDRYIKTRSRRDPNGGPQTLFDIYDRKTRKIIANARTWQEANDIVNGIRDLKGKLIDYQTPIQPRDRLAPSATKPQGYKRVANGNGYYLENPNDPDGPVVRVDWNEDSEDWVGALYANKADATATINPMEEFFDSSQDSIYNKANLSIQKELDRRNPPAPQPQAQTQPQANTGTKTNLGNDIFSVHNENEEYGIAIKGADGKWAVRVHENGIDAMNNTNPISTGSYDTPEEAEAAIRQAIAERKAQRNASNILQWQSASDGKAYLGLEGVPGRDADNSPIIGISPSPFGNSWISAGWNRKADRDAGLPPAVVNQHENEEAAKDYGQEMMRRLGELLGVRQVDPTIQENPSAGGEQLPPGVTLQDQVDAGLTTPLNPDAPLPGTNTPNQ
jgi:hypothetical protein